MFNARKWLLPGNEFRGQRVNVDRIAKLFISGYCYILNIIISLGSKNHSSQGGKEPWKDLVGHILPLFQGWRR